MLLKEYKYNEHRLELYDDGEFLFQSENLHFDYGDVPKSIPIIDIADIPILNELTKDLLKYYVEWLKCQPPS